jgi:hypothetical protein
MIETDNDLLSSRIFKMMVQQGHLPDAVPDRNAVWCLNSGDLT